MENQYTKAAEASMYVAEKMVKRLRHDCVGSEHLLLGILEESENVAAKVLEKNGVQKERVYNLIENSIVGLAELLQRVSSTIRLCIIAF